MPQAILAVDGRPSSREPGTQVSRTDAYWTFALFAIVMILIIGGIVLIHKLRSWMKEEGMI